MYHIDSKVEKPDIAYLKTQVEEMMHRGIQTGNIQEIYNAFAAERDEIANLIRLTYGIKNPNSTKDLITFVSNIDSAEVYEACCIEGKWTTNKDALSTLSLLGYQFATDILAYRKAKKYAESVKSMMDAADSNGKVHPTVSLGKTNRINYSAPALMNIPKPLLWHIIKPNKEGNTLISADIKNQEPNILINLLNATELKPALNDDRGLYEYLFDKAYSAKATLNILVTDNHEPGVISNIELSELEYVPPVYYAASSPSVVSTYYNNEVVRAIDATNVVVNIRGKKPILPDKVLIETINDNHYYVPVIWDEYKPDFKSPGIITITGTLQGVEVKCEGIYRKEFKTSWNAMTYGASSFGIEKHCKHIDGKKAFEFFSKIPEFKKYRNLCTKQSNQGNQYINTYFGTTLFADETNPGKLKRVLMDLPVQGTAADILSLLIKHSKEEIAKNELIGKLSIVYTRHDEIIFEADKNWVNEVGIDGVKEFIRNIVEHQVDDWTPFKVEVTEVKADKLYIDESDDDIQ